MRLEEFNTHIQHGTLRLAFVGMSNAGKSRRSRVLRDEMDFLWYHVDEKIQEALGFGTMKKIARWLGYPTNAEYSEHEAQYLALENIYTKQAAMQTSGKNLVCDTTGSVIHLKEETLNVLKENCLIVHLDVGEDSLEHMIDEFFREPKPVVWCGYFSQKAGESEEKALRRCYSTLLRERLTRYRKLAHITVPTKTVYDTTAAQTLDKIRFRL